MVLDSASISVLIMDMFQADRVNVLCAERAAAALHLPDFFEDLLILSYLVQALDADPEKVISCG